MKVKVNELKKGGHSFIELENWLEQNKDKIIIIDELFNILSYKFTFVEIMYLIDAYRMPRKEMKNLIEAYDNGNLKMDELKFIEELSNYYNVDKNTVKRRITEIRIINTLEKEELNGKNRKKTKNSCIK